MDAIVNNPFAALVAAAELNKAKRPSDKTAAKRAVGQPRENTKRARAEKIYSEQIGNGKAAVIALFKSDLAMTDAGANSYFYATKKKLAAAKPANASRKGKSQK